MDKLRVRAYNVRFGDALLVSVPDRGPDGVVETRHILIDVGNALIGEGGLDEAFQPVIENILSELNGNPLDLYVMTHEHMDHIQGLPYAEKHFFPNENLKEKLKTRFAWLTASSKEDYYEKHPKAKEKKLALEEAYAAIKSYLAALADPPHDLIQTLMINNNPRSSKSNVAYLRKLAGGNTEYIYRTFDLEGHHPFHETQFEILAPEEDTSVYYGHFHPLALGMSSRGGGRSKPVLAEPIPPQGVDAGAFYNLVQMRRRYVETLLSIDKAKNNTSVVFTLSWRGWKLLFTGDAEVRSWKTMNSKDVLSPVHFIKISHHGSHNGTPSSEILNKVLPLDRPDDRRRVALVSTWEGTYNNVPDEDTLKQFHDPDVPASKRRCDKIRVVYKETGDGGHTDVFFEDEESG
ncbi:hypothetical protein KAR91_45285 [Candidatus Pacearchaeota archaeon]|nr:hypothetical protein [Candidatus Pacearchaeota archaeon]